MIAADFLKSQSDFSIFSNLLEVRLLELFQNPVRNCTTLSAEVGFELGLFQPKRNNIRSSKRGLAEVGRWRRRSPAAG